MLRAPIGNRKVGIYEMDTDCFGETEFKRKLSLMFFYPSDEEGEAYPYKDATYQKETLVSQLHDNGVITYCYKNVTLSNKQEKYPVVLYSHGLMGYQMESTVLCADLASSGYIVVSVGHPYGSGAVTYTDGTMFTPNEAFRLDQHNLEPLGELWYEDIRQAITFIQQLDKMENDCMFSNRMDLENGVNLLGVSFGGCCSIGAALMEKDVRCAINLDGGLFTRLEPIYTNKPILVLCSPFNYKAHAKLKSMKCENVRIQKCRKVSHWEFLDGVYFSERGKNDRKWADSVSKQRAQLCLSFLEMA